MTALALALLLAATPPRYGGELRVLVPASALDADKLDAELARTPLELTLSRALCEPLYRLDAAGTLQPGLAQLPDPDPRTRVTRITLRTGLQTSGGAPLRARDVAATVNRLAAPGSPYRALTLPLANGSMSARSDVELAAAFEFPYPDWADALSHPGACPLPAGKRATTTGGQSGPFSLEQRLAAPAVRLGANLECPAGRPFADKLALRTGTPKSAARALASGDADLALLPIPDPSPTAGPLSVATYFAVNPSKPALAPLAALVSSAIDRAELVRIFVRGRAQPLQGLLAPSVEPHPLAPSPTAPPAPLAQHLSGELLVDGDDARAVAERLQVKLHDLGVDLKVVPVSRAELGARLGRGTYDAALVTLPALPEPGLNLAQVLLLAEPVQQVKNELAQIGALPDRAARRERASQRARELLHVVPVVPLYAQGLEVSARSTVRGLQFDGSGVFDPGALWLESTAGVRPTVSREENR